jgi:hypothetical protein
MAVPEHEHHHRQGMCPRMPLSVSARSLRVSAKPALRARRQPRAEEFVVRGIDFDNEIFVLIEKTRVVHLQGDETNLPRGGIMKVEDFDTLAAGRLSDGHARSSAGGVRENLHTAPGMDVEGRLLRIVELGASALIHPWPVVPMAAVGHLELDSASRGFSPGCGRVQKISTHAW